MEIPINHGAIIFAALTAYAATIAWYSPYIFGNHWKVALTAVQKKKSKKSKSISRPKYYKLIPLAGLIITSYVLAHFLYFATTILALDSTAISGAIAAGWAWLGFTAVTTATNAHFERRPRDMWAIEVGNHLLNFVIIGFIIGAFGF